MSLLVIAGCTSGVNRLPKIAAAPDQLYRLAAGDEIRITVYGFDSITSTYVVSDSNAISLPLLQTIAVGGMTPAMLEQAIADQLRSRDLAPNPSVSVQVQKTRPFFILGEVQRPGQYPYVPGMTLLTAVSIAGGYTFRAQTRAAELRREQNGVRQHGQADPNTPVLPGDIISIKERSF
jgi:polysaccharide export outer membrane protein